MRIDTKPFMVEQKAPSRRWLALYGVWQGRRLLAATARNHAVELPRLQLFN
jgi:hypothetical protein